ncbi:MAG TPA: bifunctional UDP-3-O-[3-hydroxymyristoyl] N-acetylglucosamine deacetylase/3-hydroxyacyl-ACP dehydratase [Bacteroidales bacterium]|nr:bifunctional UDP-3-O-[3-hydroxymyristoyl] N-acetylglucosamine deacetylase/3-hydroxyacyl-ACP dehydratase [Bacteroidales bacterium]HPS51092.1 bifunctional UDP-3-O-[3-hydroxymyristoyl] N-acetylglucosamine deacetylase/3-hydroxyacyl-ACP dehydratase [Bacteroidales bacterium]
MSEKQRTIKSPVSISGVGLHTGNDVTITFKPAPDNYGFKFRRTDLNSSTLVDADVDNVVDTSRGTSLEQDGIRIDTVEHVLASLTGMEIDNALIEMNQSETPILDGSARFYVEAIKSVGVVEQKALRNYFELNSNITYVNPEKKVEMIAIPSKDFRVSVMIDYESKVLQSQNATLNSIKQFRDDFSSCRTFVFLHELEYLLNNNLIKGGDVSNAIVFVDRIISRKELDHLAHLFKKPKIEVLREGILNNLELQFPNEPARHKLLDIIGDLTLVGMPIRAHIIATRPGHYSNIQFARMIKKQMKREKQPEGGHKFDLNKTPVYNINQIKNILPHRPPFLFIDKILEIGKDYVVGVKNVTMNESFFVGHFPDEPVMPGVIQIEAMAQSGGILALSTVDDPQNYTTLFVKIENVRFRQKVVPGDTIVFFNQLNGPIRRGLISMKGIAYVGNKIVMEAEMMAQIQRK